ncbi:MAG: phosphoribosylamine--glycine ligase [Longimicrobiales bacterium]
MGNGGREHALLWKLRRDAPAAELFVARGNGGTGALATCLPLDPTDAPAIGAWASANGIDLVVVGPEAPLDLGIVDVLARHGVAAFGPTKAATAIEASKAYAKDLMRRAGVPTAGYRTFTESDEAEAYIRERAAPLVVKASGLAAGKGAVVCDDADEAVAAARAMLVHGEFGGAGAEIVVEERLTGEEVSIFALCDGENALPMLPAQDYKRAYAGDRGPNTGGMGAYAPVSGLPADFVETVRTRILEPTLAALADDGRPFRGLLYAGLMRMPDGPKVIEFNARFGDPETQALLPLLSSSLLDPLLAVARGDRLGDVALDWTAGVALTTVLASGGYPGPYDKGRPIEIPAWVEDADDLIVFHAGTKASEDGLRTAGGRALAVTAVATDIGAAAARSREAADAIEFEGKQWRDDIGWRELERQV